MKRERAYIDPLGNLHVGAERISLRRNPESWQAWLASGQGFQVLGLHVDGHGVPLCSVRVKRIKGLLFWYAERKRNGRTRSVYVGKSDALTLERLWWAAERLASHDQLSADEAGL